jgi:hypothetical protein
VVDHLLSEVPLHERIPLGTAAVCGRVLEDCVLALPLEADSVIAMGCVCVEAVDFVNQSVVYVGVAADLESVSHVEDRQSENPACYVAFEGG